MDPPVSGLGMCLVLFNGSGFSYGFRVSGFWFQIFGFSGFGLRDVPGLDAPSIPWDLKCLGFSFCFLFSVFGFRFSGCAWS
jgi:hypothetical protein